MLFPRRMVKNDKKCHFNTTCLKSQKGQDIFNSPLHLSCKPTALVPLFPSEVQHQAPFPRHFAANLVWALRNILEVFLQTQIHCAHIPTQCHSGKTRDHIKHLVAGCRLDVGVCLPCSVSNFISENGRLDTFSIGSFQHFVCPQNNLLLFNLPTSFSGF